MSLPRIRLLLLLFLALNITVACTNNGGLDPFPNITLPIHPNAINAEIKYNAPFKGAKATVYRVKMPFPAKDLTAFYDSQLAKMGYESFTESDIFNFEWMNFNYKSGEWKKTTNTDQGARYTAAWVDHQKTVIIWLYIAYEYDGNDAKWTVTPLVSVNMSKFSNFKDSK
jgi:hypothetical protein